jgi:hypothetical protein
MCLNSWTPACAGVTECELLEVPLKIIPHIKSENLLSDYYVNMDFICRCGFSRETIPATALGTGHTTLLMKIAHKCAPTAILTILNNLS